MKAAGRDLQRTTVQFDNRRKEQQAQLDQRRAEIAARKAQARLVKARAAEAERAGAAGAAPNFRRAAWVAVAGAPTQEAVLKNAGVQAQRNQLQHENNRRAQLAQIQMRMQKKQADRLDRENSLETAHHGTPMALPGLVPRPSMDGGRPGVRSVPPSLPALTTNGRPGLLLQPPAAQRAAAGRPRSPGAVLSASLADWASSI